jgi:hypothetical protein
VPARVVSSVTCSPWAVLLELLTAGEPHGLPPPGGRCDPRELAVERSADHRGERAVFVAGEFEQLRAGALGDVGSDEAPVSLGNLGHLQTPLRVAKHCSKLY